MELKDGGPAFPQLNYWNDKTMTCGPSGMSLRDWYAGMALPEAMRIAQSIINIAVPPDPRKNAARIAYEQADAMIAEREK